MQIERYFGHFYYKRNDASLRSQMEFGGMLQRVKVSNQK
jgi:hypothetical protein